MTQVTLEELERRLAIVEAQMAQSIIHRAQRAEGDWRKTVDIFSGNEAMRAIDEAAMQFREADREAARNDPHYFDEK